MKKIFNIPQNITDEQKDNISYLIELLSSNTCRTKNHNCYCMLNNFFSQEIKLQELTSFRIAAEKKKKMTD